MNKASPEYIGSKEHLEAYKKVFAELIKYETHPNLNDARREKIEELDSLFPEPRHRLREYVRLLKDTGVNGPDSEGFPPGGDTQACLRYSKEIEDHFIFIKQIKDKIEEIKNELMSAPIEGEIDDRFMVDMGGTFFFPEYEYSVKKTKPGELLFRIITHYDSKTGIDPKDLEPTGSVSKVPPEQFERMYDNAKVKNLLKGKISELEEDREAGGENWTEEKEDQLREYNAQYSKDYFNGKPRAFKTGRTSFIKNIRNDIDRFIEKIDSTDKKHAALKEYLRTNKPRIKDGRIFYTGKI